MAASVTASRARSPATSRRRASAMNHSASARLYGVGRPWIQWATVRVVAGRRTAGASSGSKGRTTSRPSVRRGQPSRPPAPLSRRRARGRRGHASRARARRRRSAARRDRQAAALHPLDEKPAELGDALGGDVVRERGNLETLEAELVERPVAHETQRTGHDASPARPRTAPVPDLARLRQTPQSRARSPRALSRRPRPRRSRRRRARPSTRRPSRRRRTRRSRRPRRGTAGATGICRTRVVERRDHGRLVVGPQARSLSRPSLSSGGRSISVRSLTPSRVARSPTCPAGRHGRFRIRGLDAADDDVEAGVERLARVQVGEVRRLVALFAGERRVLPPLDE